MRKDTDPNFITSEYLSKWRSRQKKKKASVLVCSFLAVVVALTTVAEMIQPAVTVTRKESVLDCGFPVHEHTEECYETLYDEYGNETGKELICDKADYIIHQHTEECYKTVTHEDEQLEEKVLICDLPEIKKHEHDDSCYEDKEVLICNTEEHTHDDSCYETTYNLICTEEHEHTDYCYEPVYNLVCGKEEHVHDETCYETQKELICDKLELHKHDESCYDEEGNRICGKIELLEHNHTEDCIKVVEVVDEDKLPEQKFYGETDQLTVSVIAPEGAFPKDTTMKVVMVDDEDVLNAAASAAESADTQVTTVQAADITFFDTEGNEIQPLVPIQVILTPIERLPSEEETAAVYHIDDEGVAKEVEQTEPVLEENITTEAMVFDTDSFSVYALVYTVDFGYEVNGQVFKFSIQGGGGISFSKLVEILNIIDNSQNSEAVAKFIEDIAGIEFTDPELVSVTKVEETTSVGAIKELLGLECEYSEELTEDEIAEINATEIQSGDWALISIKPFTTEEYLMVTMKSGDVFKIKVTDAQEVTSTDTLDSNKSYIICYEENGNFHVLKTDGTEQIFTDPSIFNTGNAADRLGDEYRWSFYYVFTENDREHNLNNKYYFIRPVADKSKTIALNETGDDIQLVQNGTNNVAVIPQDGGGFCLEGNHIFAEDGHLIEPIKLAYTGNRFAGTSGTASVIKIYEQEELATYDFTVKSADETMGSVSVAGKQPITQQIPGEDGSYKTETYYIAETNTDKKNSSLISATPSEHRNTAGVNKYVFDYWELNGQRLENVGATIPAGTLQIDYNASTLIAHFKINPDYEYPDDEKEGTTIEDMAAWLTNLKNSNIPLNPEGCKKTAEVYDYENRIYRVDLTAQSSLQTFDGTIDLGFIIDASQSMKFPSKLVPVSGLENKHIEDINSNVIQYYEGWKFWQSWGLDTRESYYVISDESGTSTVVRMFYDNGEWKCSDASKTDSKTIDQARVRNSDNGGPFKNGESDRQSNYYYQIYEDGDKGNNRLYYLRQSLKGTLSELNQILELLSLASDNAADNPDVQVAWNTFHNFIPKDEVDGATQYTFGSVKGTGIQIPLENENFAGGTSTDIGLLDAIGYRRNDVSSYDDYYDKEAYKSWDKNEYTTRAYNKINGKGFNWDSSATKYAVLITDGAPQRSGKAIDSRYVEEAAQKLNEEGINLITVGLSVDNVPGGKILLYNIADTINGEKMFYSAKSGDELENVLLHIISQIMEKASVQGNVTDTISETFYPVDKATGRALTPESGQYYYIDIDGNAITDNNGSPVTSAPSSGVYGRIEASGNTYKVTWEQQNFTWEGWHGTVYVKAKEDFLGGNAVTTNTGKALIEAVSYTIPSKQDPIPLSNKGYIIVDGQRVENPNYSRSTTLNTPRVNVNELNFLQNSTEWTVYLGTQVNPKEELKKLYENILVEEVVNDAIDTDQDKYQLPDRINYSNAASHHYSLVPDDFSDQRNSQGEAKTFKLMDLIRELIDADDNLRSTYIVNDELNWNKFLEEAVKPSGIVIPYKHYGLDDNSSIKITLVKTIAEGEENDLIGKSPHKTTVVGAPVEKYTLSVAYSPDYNVLPRGQGGNNTIDFQTGTYGSMYQGHAAGTETSENNHIINVIERKLQISKTDVNGAPLEAKFKLYRMDSDGAAVDGLPEGKYREVELETDPVTGKTELIAMYPDENSDDNQTNTYEDSQKSYKKYYVDNTAYYIVETDPPAGYVGYDQPINATLSIHETKTPVLTDEAGNVILYNWNQNADVMQNVVEEHVSVSESENGSLVTFSVINDKYVDLSIIKTDPDGRELPGAVFKLIKDQVLQADIKVIIKDGSWENEQDRISVVNGEFTIPVGGVKILELTAGNYQLEETQVPAGYIKTLQPIKFTVSRDGTITYTNPDDNPTPKVVYSSTDLTYTVQNEPGAELPMTGGIGTRMFTILGGLLISLSGGLLLRKRKKRDYKKSCG